MSQGFDLLIDLVDKVGVEFDDNLVNNVPEPSEDVTGFCTRVDTPLPNHNFEQAGAWNLGITACSHSTLRLLEGNCSLSQLGWKIEDALAHLHRILSSPVLSTDAGGGMRPDLFKTDAPVPGDEVNNGINVVEI